jgi:hypothetical protein
MQRTIHSAILLPTEAAPTLREVKLALLSFDRVHLPNPDDREVIPRVAFGGVFAPGFPAFMDSGPVAPLPKRAGFDDAFDRLRAELRRALTDNSLVIDATSQHPPGSFGLGFPQSAEVAPNHALVLHVFRGLASRCEMLDAAAAGLPKGVDDLAELQTSGAALQPMQGLPDIAKLSHPEEGLATMLRPLAAARVATVVRYVAAAEFRSLSPLTHDPGFSALLQTLRSDLAHQLPALSAASSSASLLTRLHSVVVRSFIDTPKLDELSLADVLSIRTRAWGAAMEARTELLHRLQVLAEEVDPMLGTQFEQRCSALLDKYHAESKDYWNEAARLGVGATCALTPAGIAALASHSLGEVVHNLTGVPGTGLLAIGGLGAAAIRAMGPKALDLLLRKRSLTQTDGYVLARPYGNILTARR